MDRASLQGPPACNDEPDGNLPPAMGVAWAYSSYIPVPPEVASGTLSTPSDHSDHVNLLKDAITQFLRGATRPPTVAAIIAQFRHDYLSHQTLPPNIIPVKGYVQLRKPARPTAMDKWLPKPPCEWSMVPGGLGGSTAFKEDMKKTDPWITVEVLGKIGLNNAARREKKVDMT